MMSTTRKIGLTIVCLCLVTAAIGFAIQIWMLLHLWLTTGSL